MAISGLCIGVLKFIVKIRGVTVLNFRHEQLLQFFFLPGHVAQSVTCLATDVLLTADPGVTSLTPVWSHDFVEYDREIISRVILLPFAKSFQKDCCQLQAKVCA